MRIILNVKIGIFYVKYNNIRSDIESIELEESEWMEKVVLISCVSKKREYACKARDLYISELFKKSLAYAEKVNKPDKIFILSAEYGVVSIEKVLNPYYKTLNKMNKIERLAWSNLVIEELNQHIDIENTSNHTLKM